MTGSLDLYVRVCHGDPLAMAGLVSLIGQEPGLHVQVGSEPDEGIVDAVVADHACARGGPLYLCERTKTIFRHGAARAGFIAGEEDVLRFLVKGDCNKGIARKLNISANTVKAHVSRLCEKLHVASRVQVAVKATQRGLVRV
jgi:DNA-binding CsgD family transcriptional regulator